MSTETWTIGQLARRTGVSIRALHHYDEIGLLSPAERTDSGYRLYVAEDIARLHRIKALRQLGFTLTEIRNLLEQCAVSPREMVEDHLRQMRAHMELEQRLCERLQMLARRLSSAESISSEEFLDVIEVMSMVEKNEKYYIPEQLAWLRERADTIGEERIHAVESEWPELIAQVRTEMERGTDPRDERAQRLAARWRGLIQEFSGGHAGIEASLQTMYVNEPDMRARSGIDPDLAAYIGKALAMDQ